MAPTVGIERLPIVMHLPALTVLGRVRARLGEAHDTALLEQATGEPLTAAHAARFIERGLTAGAS